jgi:O-antigen/teichoic acid export membrane protein
VRRLFRIRFIREVAVSGGAQIAYAASAMVGGILVARVLGPDGRGALSVLTALGAMAVLLASLGLHTSGIYFIGRFADERDSVISNNTITAVVGGIVTAVGVLALSVAFHDQLLNGISLGLLVVFLPWIPFNYFNEFGCRIALGLGSVMLMNLPILIGSIGLVAGTAAVLAIFGDHLVPLLILRVGIEAAGAIALFIGLRRLGRFPFRPSLKLFRRQLNYGLRNYTSSLLWMFLLQSDILLCNHFLGKSETGVYSVAVSAGLPVTVLAAAIGTLTFQRVSADDNPENRAANTNRVLRVLFPLVVLGSAVIAGAAPWVVPFIYGSDFSGAVSALIIILPGLVALTLETVVMNFLAGEGSPSIIYKAPFAALVVNVVANLFVIPRWGIDGASATSSVCYILVLVVVLRFYMQRTNSTLRDVLLLRREDILALRGGAVAQVPVASG